MFVVCLTPGFNWRCWCFNRRVVDYGYGTTRGLLSWRGNNGGSVFGSGIPEDGAVVTDTTHLLNSFDAFP